MSGGGADVPWTPGLGACRSLQAFRSILSCLFGLTRANLGGVTRHEKLRHQPGPAGRSEEHTSELQSQSNLVCRLLLEKKKKSDRLPMYNHPLLYNAYVHLYLL